MVEETGQNNIVINMLQLVLNKVSEFENQIYDLKKRIDHSDLLFNPPDRGNKAIASLKKENAHLHQCMDVMEKTNRCLVQLVNDYEKGRPKKPSVPVKPLKVEFGLEGIRKDKREQLRETNNRREGLRLSSDKMMHYNNKKTVCKASGDDTNFDLETILKTKFQNMENKNENIYSMENILKKMNQFGTRKLKKNEYVFIHNFTLTNCMELKLTYDRIATKVSDEERIADNKYVLNGILDVIYEVKLIENGEKLGFKTCDDEKTFNLDFEIKKKIQNMEKRKKKTYSIETVLNKVIRFGSKNICMDEYVFIHNFAIKNCLELKSMYNRIAKKVSIDVSISDNKYMLHAFGILSLIREAIPTEILDNADSIKEGSAKKAYDLGKNIEKEQYVFNNRGKPVSYDSVSSKSSTSSKSGINRFVNDISLV